MTARAKGQAKPTKKQPLLGTLRGPCTVTRLGEPQAYDGKRLTRAWCHDAVTVFGDAAQAQAAIEKTVEQWKPDARERVGADIFTVVVGGAS